MKTRIVLPRLRRFRVSNFRPIFAHTVEMQLRHGVNVILGGNGLGKTTLIQAVIYGLTGGSEGIERDKGLRWNHAYFRSRLAGSQAREAAVEVEFSLGDVEILVRRGFTGPQVTAVRVAESELVEGPSAQSAFNAALKMYGGYESANDFAFVLHRLLYLPESRRLLAWDADAQTKLLMLLNQDVAPEEDFQRRRELLKELDSNKRHIHVALGKAQDQLATLMEFDPEQVEPETEPVPASRPSVDELRTGVAKLQRVSNERLRADRELADIRKSLTQISEQVENLQNQLDQEEASLVLSFLSEQERENELPLQKLVEIGICPACGTRSAALQAVAKQHAKEHSCTLCGSEIESLASAQIATLRSRLSEKINAQRQLQENFRLADNRARQLRTDEQALQLTVDQLRFSQPVVGLTERELPSQSRDSLLALRDNLDAQELDLAAQIEKLGSELEREYDTFMTTVSDRLERVRGHYSRYATEFLGLECTLAEAESSDRLLTLLKFVPMFNGVERTSEESCSEAQRFFLDIAFRMALIDVAAEMSGSTATFLCETPETALDMSYVANVVKMFRGFTERGQSILLTANIQLGGIAEQLLKVVPLRNRSSRLLNLLNFGQLSAVHQANKRKLNSAVRRIFR